MQYASENLIPVTLELGGKSPNIFRKDIMDQSPEFISKCVEGFLLAYFNQGEVCTCPSRALIHEDIYDDFMALVKERAAQIVQGNPFDEATMIGAQASAEQYEKIKSYLAIGKEEGAEVLFGGDVADSYEDGFYVQPTAFKGHNKMRIFQEEIFGPVVSVTTFKTDEEASKSLTIRCTDWGPAFGPLRRTPLTNLVAPSKPVEFGPTATTNTRRTQPLAVTSNQVSAVRTTK